MYRKKQRCLTKVWQHFWIVVMALLSLCMTLGKAQAKEPLCAEVKIVIEQKLSFERQAFDAKMIIHNGLEDMVVENVNIDLLFMDAEKQPVLATSDPDAENARFFYRIDSLDGIASTNGNGRVETKTSAEIHWMIIPTAGAAESRSTMYYVGAKVSYTLNGQPTELEVTPEYIMVKPLPKLAIDYFLPAEVYGADPFAEEVEPAEPFTFGVRITNSGFGDAPNTMIESAQPKIVENKQNLLSGFEILGGYVSDIPTGKSLLLNFDNIAAGKAKVGRWSMISTLSGKFVEFNASFSHADELGGAVTSLLERVTTHTLIHDVKVDLDGRDAIRDFLALDGDVLRVYESDGIDTEVTDRSADARLANSNGLTTISFPAYSGFVYVKLSDPHQGKALPINALRSDGKTLPEENIWLSKTRNDDLSWSYYINIFDASSTGQYAFEWAQTPKTAISGKVYQDINGNGVQDPGENGIGAVDVMLNGFDDSGMQISLVAYTNSNGLFAFNDLNAGLYALDVGPVEGMTNGLAVAGDAGGDANNGSINAIRLTAGTPSQGYLFAKQPGSVVVPNGPSISGTVYLDSNNNGVMNNGEPGLAGIRVSLSGIYNVSTLTDFAGHFEFRQLPPGTYDLSVADARRLLNGRAVAGSAGGNALIQGKIQSIILNEGDKAEGYLFAKTNFAQGSFISGTVYEDTNGNNSINKGEPLLSGISVFLTGIDERGRVISKTAITDVQGNFVINDLDFGCYDLLVGSAANMIDSSVAIGTAGGQYSRAGGRILQINLTKDTLNGQGYNFAKRHEDAPPLFANLTLTLEDLSWGRPVLNKETRTRWTVRNLGPDKAIDVKLKVVLPPSVTLTWASGNHYKDGVWSVGNLDSGLNSTLTLWVEPNDLGEDVVFSGELVSQRDDRDVSNNKATFTWPGRNAMKTDLEIYFDPITGPGLPDSAGVDKWIYVKAKNHGPDTAYAISADVDLPDNLKLLSAQALHWASYDEGRWDIDYLDPGDSITLLLKTEVLSLDQDANFNLKIFNSHGVDNNLSNNSASGFWKGRDNVEADLSVAFKHSGTNQIGKNISLDVIAANAGPDTVFEAIATIELPDQVTLVKAPNNCSFIGQLGTCKISKFKGPSSSTIKLTLQASSFADDPTVKASITAQGKDPDLSNNSATFVLRG